MVPRSLAALSVVALIACHNDVSTTPLDDPTFDNVSDGAAEVVAPGFTVFFDEATFVRVSGASQTVTFPSARGLTPAPYVENGVSFVQAAGFNNRLDDFTPIFAGIELAVSGAENVDITFQADPHSFGIWMQDGWEVGFINWTPPQDSRFELTFCDAEGTVLASVAVDPPKDEAFFVGAVSAGRPIAVVEIREVGSSIGELFEPYVENDFFSTLLTSSAPPTPVDKDDCKDGQWRWYGFENQGLCVRAVVVG
jgi:hypothetical protein